MDDTFLAWLNERVKEVGSIRQLARDADISHTTVADVLAGLRSPTFEFCSAIAKALDLPAELVFRKAGLLPAQKPDDELRELILYYYDRMPADMQDHFRSVARALAESVERYETEENEDQDRETGRAPTPA